VIISCLYLNDFSFYIMTCMCVCASISYIYIYLYYDHGNPINMKRNIDFLKAPSYPYF